MKQVKGTPVKPHYGGDFATIKPFAKDQTIPAICAAVGVLLVLVLILLFGQSRSAQTATVGDVPAANQTAVEGADIQKGGTVEVPSNKNDYSVDSTVIIQGNRAMEIFSVSQKWLTRYGENINTFASTVPNSHVYVLLAPTSVEFYGPDDYKTKNHLFETAIDYAYTPMKASNITAIDCRDTMARHTDEYIYLRTDHHWTATGAYYAYVTFCRAAGLEYPKLSEYKSGEIEGFVGSLYSKTQEAVLKNDPDTVKYYFPLTKSTGHAYDTAALTGGRTAKVINTNVSSKYAYLCFIEGDNPILKYDTENHNGKSILMVKESYGNAFAPFLTDNYETVYVVDPRKVDLNLTSFVQQHGIDDVLFLNYAFAPSNPTYRNAFEKMLGVR